MNFEVFCYALCRSFIFAQIFETSFDSFPIDLKKVALSREKSGKEHDLQDARGKEWNYSEFSKGELSLLFSEKQSTKVMMAVQKTNEPCPSESVHGPTDGKLQGFSHRLTDAYLRVLERLLPRVPAK